MPDKQTTGETLDEIVERVVDLLDDLRSNAVYPCLTAKGVAGQCIQPEACACRAQLAWDFRHALTTLARTHALVPREASAAMLHAGFGTADTDNVWRWDAMLSASDLLASLREGG